MGRVVDPPEVPVVDVGVDLGRAQVRMAEHGLNRSEVRTAPYEVRSEAMPKFVRRDGSLQPRRESETPQPQEERLTTDPSPAAAAGEYRVEGSSAQALWTIQL